jgi:selenide,water dikinase
MPIVDDPYDFGRIASANAISDVYAMGGRPVLAIAILGWPVDKLSAAIAQRVIDGSRSICREAGIPLAGGHSIDSPEPIFGLAVNGLVAIKNLKKNNTAKPGDALLLTKKLGVGILTTAEKKGKLEPGDKELATRQMEMLNRIGELLGEIPAVTAMTDVTGFGLLGHLAEICEGSGVSADLSYGRIPLLSPKLKHYIEVGCVPGGTLRNLDSYGSRIAFSSDLDKDYAGKVLADPQTSGGLLVCVGGDSVAQVRELLRNNGLYDEVIGRIGAEGKDLITVNP